MFADRKFGGELYLPIITIFYFIGIFYIVPINIRGIFSAIVFMSGVVIATKPIRMNYIFSCLIVAALIAVYFNTACLFFTKIIVHMRGY